MRLGIRAEKDKLEFSHITMQLYIDESGNLGTTGRFFVIACLNPTTTIPRRIKSVIRKSCIKFGTTGQPLEEIKGFKLKFTEKQELLNRLCFRDDFLFSYIVAEKKHIQPQIISDPNLCYNYLASHLFKRIIKGTTDDIQIVLDNHSIKVKSLNSLADYIKIQAYTKWGYTGKITFGYQDSKNHYCLQAVDLISNVVYGKYEHNKQHLYGQLSNFMKHSIEFPYQKFNT